MYHAMFFTVFVPLCLSECFGEPWRNVQLPFSVIYIGKGKPRPELSARYLIRHLFPEDVLVKSNVYGNLERGVLPLDSNRIGALKGMFLRPQLDHQQVSLFIDALRIAFLEKNDLLGILLYI